MKCGSLDGWFKLQMAYFDFMSELVGFGMVPSTLPNVRGGGDAGGNSYFNSGRYSTFICVGIIEMEVSIINS